MAILKPEQLSSGSYSISGSFSGSFSGDGSNLANLPIPQIETGSFVTTSSFNAFTGSYNTGSFTGSFTGDGSGLTGIISASFAQTASYAPNFANTNLTFTGDRSHNTAGNDLQITTDNGNFGESFIYMTPTLAEIGTANAYVDYSTRIDSQLSPGGTVQRISPSGVSIGFGGIDAQARLDVKSQGALSTDIAFRVRNSADNANLVTFTGIEYVGFGVGAEIQQVNGSSVSVGIRSQVNGVNYFKTFTGGGIAIGQNSNATNFNSSGNIITGVAIGLNTYSWQSSVSIGQNTSASSTTTVAIGNNTSAGGSAGSNIVSIGNNVNAATISGGGAKNVCIGSNLIAGRDNYEQIIIGADLGNRASSAGSLNVNKNIYIGGNLDNAVNSRTGVISLGFGASSVSKINPNIDNSFSLYFSDNNRSFFVNKNTNVVMKSLGALTAGTDFDSSATNTFTVYNGTIPSINTSDSFQQYSADITAGNAAPHFRTENGSIIKLYQQSAVTSSQGLADVLTNVGLLATGSSIATAFERLSDFQSPYHYSGNATLGTSTSSTGWIINRIDFTTPGSPITLQGTGSWDNRTSLIYS
jgi:hypothetical protein